MSHSLTDQIICISGMERSGTSLIARTLNILGVYLGPTENSILETEYNAKGCWEHRQLLDINEQILIRLGGNTHEIPVFPFQWEKQPFLTDLRSKAREIIQKNFSGHPLWGWKDTRNCLTLPFWQNILPSIDYVICIRNPIDVAQSLVNRKWVETYPKAFDLWMNYTYELLRNTAGKRRHIVFYEDMMTNWDVELKRFAKFLNNPSLSEQESIREKINQFVSQELQHYETPIENLIDNQDVNFPAKALFSILRLNNDVEINALNNNSYITNHFSDKILDIFSFYSSLEQKNTNTLLLEGNNLRERLIQLEAELISENAELKAALSSKSIEFENLKTQAASYKNELIELNFNLSQIKTERDNLITDILQAKTERNDLDKILFKYKGDLVRIKNERDELRNNLHKNQIEYESIIIQNEDNARTVNKLEEEISNDKAHIASLNNQLKAIDVYIQQKEQDIRIALSALEITQSGIGWYVLQRYRNLTYRLMPTGSLRRRFYDFMLGGAIAGRKRKKSKSNIEVIGTTLARSGDVPITSQIQDFAVCTIASKNYLSAVRVFAHSLRKTNPNTPVFVLLVDQVDGAFDPTAEPFQVITLDELNNIPEPQYFKFKYTPIELNTAAKPYFLEYLFKKIKLSRVCYFDPDIYIFHSLQGLWDLLNGYSIILTPHITQPYSDNRDPSELAINLAGIFNLGFIGISNTPSSDRFLQWWKNRMYDFCFMAPNAGMHVDQNWVNFAPVMYDGVFILRDPAYNIAYWNLHYRGKQLRFLSQNRLLIDDRPAVFYHFSGLPLNNIEKISIHQNRFTLSDFPNLRPLFEMYRNLLLNNGYEQTRNLEYAYGRFENGAIIPSFARQIYNHLDKNQIREFGDPFSVQNKKPFFEWLNEPVDNDSQLVITRLHMELYRARTDLRSIFPDPLGRDRSAFRIWLENSAMRDHNLDRCFVFVGQLNKTIKRQSSHTSILLFSIRQVAKEAIKSLVQKKTGVVNFLRRVDRAIFGSPASSLAATPIINTNGTSSTIESLNSLPFGINIAGYIQGEFGVAEVSRASIRAVEKTNLPFVINNISTSNHHYNDKTYKTFSDENPFCVNLIHVNADMVPEYVKLKTPQYFRNRYNIGYWFWELANFPARWQASFEPFDEIWVASTFCQESIAKSSPIPVVKMTFPIILSDKEIAPDRDMFKIPKDKFLFLFSFDYLSVFERKNPLAVLKAFNKAFDKRDDVILVVKTINMEYAPEKVEQLKAEMRRSNVHLLEGHLSRHEMLTLVASCDSYVSLHRSEGFGLGMAQAMYFGKPVIATGYSGNMEFMNHNNSFLVKYKLTELEQDFGPYEKGNFWAEPDINDAADLMYRVFQKTDDVVKIAEQGRLNIQNKMTPSITGRQIIDRLNLRIR